MSATDPFIRRDPIVRRMVALHPAGCDCWSCCPFHVPQRRNVYGPSTAMVQMMSSSDAPPAGWQRVPEQTGGTA